MLNFEKFAGKHSIQYLTSGHHHCHQGWIQTHCPFCSDGSHGYHIGFSIEGGNFNCWRCGSHTAWDYVGKVLNLNRKDLIYKALNEFDQSRNNVVEKSAKSRKKNIKHPPGTIPLTETHRKYLKKRGFNPEELESEWGIKATRHLSGEWKWRIIIPIHDETGHIVAYQGRTILKGVKPKYRMSDDSDIVIDPKSLLYGLHKTNQKSVVVVEGVTGVWNIGPGAVGTFGIDWKHEQANILRKYENRFILFDPEPVAQKKAYELAKWLSYYPGNTEIINGFKHDSGELTEKEKREILQLLT